MAALEEPSATIVRSIEEVLSERHRLHQPVVTLSWAQSARGALAHPDGSRAELSGPESMRLTHRLRAMHAGILVGIGTVLADDPLLSVRLVEGPQPQPMVLDTELRFPIGARLLGRLDRRPWILHAEDSRERGAKLIARGARLLAVPRGPGGLDLREVLRALRDAGIDSLMVEGGARVLRSFLAAGLAHQAVITISPSEIEGIRVLDDPAAAPAGLVETCRHHVGEDVVACFSRSPGGS